EARMLRVEDGLEAAIKRFLHKVMVARIDARGRELEELVKKGELTKVPEQSRQWEADLADDVREAGAEKALAGRFLPVRRKAWQPRLEQARQDFLARLKANRDAEIGEVGAKAMKELEKEAVVVGRLDELKAFVERCEVFADVARKAKKE